MDLKNAVRYHILDHAFRRVRKVLPPSDRWQGPATGKYIARAELPKHPLVHYQEIYPEQRIAWSDLQLPPAEAAEVEALSQIDDWTNQIRVGFFARSQKMRYTWYSHSLLTANDDLYGNLHFPHTPDFDYEPHPMFTHPRQSPLDLQRRGKTLVLLSLPNLYHFVFEAIARLALAQEAGMEASSYDHFLGEPPSLPFHHEIFGYLGIPTDRILSPSSGAQHCRFSELHFSNTTYGIPPELVCILRSYLAAVPRVSPPFACPRKLYLSRAAYPTRRLVNETAVTELLARHGFTTVCPHELSYAQQKVLFEEAEVIVSSHGAGLANLIWCKPGTKVIELRSKHHTRGYWKLYWNISSACNLQHRWVSCEDTPNAHAHGPQYSDLIAPLDSLAACLEN